MIVDCEHARDIGKQGTVQCLLGLFGGMPHRGVCLKACIPQGLAPKATDRKSLQEDLNRLRKLREYGGGRRELRL